MTTPNDDPDARDLPPYVQLPDACEFRLGQLKARLVVAGVALGCIGAMFVLVPRHRMITGICAGIVGIAVVVNLVRYLTAPRK